MSSTRAHTLQVPRLPVAPEHLGPFRWGRVAGGILLTNDAGEWQHLAEPDFRALLQGQLGAEHPKWPELQAKGFLRSDLDLEELARKIRRKRRYLGAGPHLAVVITTLRCNQSCQYCHASRTDMDRTDTDMSLETARMVVDHAMRTPSPYLCFEYQGGEPTVNFDVIKFCVEYSRERNKVEGKVLDHSVVTNLTYMTDEMADWLVANNVLLCTSLDGPEDVHDGNRPWTGKKGGAYATVLDWMKRINQRYIDRGLDPELWHVDALMTTTRRSMAKWREIIDQYVELGIRNVHIRPLNPFGFATKTWRAIGYSMDEWLEHYARSLDYILELNKQGVQVMEGTAATFLKKMLTADDPNFVDIRTPVGSGTGQICYGFDGSIFPSDEGRMVHGMGDDIFRLGHVSDTTFEQATNHPTVRAIAAASWLDTLPQCSTCWNAPWCGVRPLHNYLQSGDLFGQRPLAPKCKQHMKMVELLVERLVHDPEGQNAAIFRRWTVDRPRLPDEPAAPASR
jgi:His-Xaa-Ser system radical SAM maturase HxsB